MAPVPPKSILDRTQSVIFAVDSTVGDDGLEFVESQTVVVLPLRSVDLGELSRDGRWDGWGLRAASVGKAPNRAVDFAGDCEGSEGTYEERQDG